VSGVLGLAGSILVTGGCVLASPPTMDPVAGVRATLIAPSPEGAAFRYPVWLAATRQIVITYEPGGRSFQWEIQLYAMSEDGSGLKQLDLPDDPKCKQIERISRPLPDGRLGYVQRCFPVFDASTGGALMGYDPVAKRVSPLVPYPLWYNIRSFSFAPGMRRGILNDAKGLYEGLVWLDPDGMKPLLLPLARAGDPSWSPDGKQITLDGVPPDPTSGPDRATLPRKLYVLSADTLPLRELFGDIYQAWPTSWSPDGRWLVATIQFQNRQRGVWLIDPASGKRRLLLDAVDAEVATWLPDGRSLLVTIGESNFGGITGPKSKYTAGVYRLDLPSLDGLMSN
jgi:hypothetical protein